MDLGEAFGRIRDHSELNAFISVSDESGSGSVVAVKDLVDVAGMVTTAGGIILPPTPATEDAAVVKHIRAHGCVVVGKANLHEFAYGVTSVNPHYGPVRNPHDPSRVAGGSSGGSAVAVAMRMCDWAIGSDTGGSIRVPASLCGAVPRGWVADLDAPTATAWRMVSHNVPEIDFVERDALFRNGLTLLLVEAAAYHRRWVEEYPEKYGSDVLAHLKRGLTIPAIDLVDAMHERPRLVEAAEEAMDGIDALLLPATAIVAPSVEAGTEVREPLTRFTRPFNTTGQPVVTLPAPVTGMPVGMQVVGRTNAGALRAALWLEREWRNRPR